MQLKVTASKLDLLDLRGINKCNLSIKLLKRSKSVSLVLENIKATRRKRLSKVMEALDLGLETAVTYVQHSGIEDKLKDRSVREIMAPVRTTSSYLKLEDRLSGLVVNLVVGRSSNICSLGKRITGTTFHTNVSVVRLGR